MHYRIKNWDHFQHYHDRNPPWIKLHFKILSSSDWVTLDDASRVLAIACMLIASHNKGIIDGSEVGLAYLKRVAYLNKPPNLKPLISCGFLIILADASTLQANASQETETYKEYKEETEKNFSWENFLQSLNPANRTLLQQIEALLSSTRKSGKIAPSVMDALSVSLQRYSTEAVISACRIYADRNYAAEGKAEKYLLGIVRGEQKRTRSNLTSPPASQPQLTQGQLAIRSAMRRQLAELEAESKAAATVSV